MSNFTCQIVNRLEIVNFKNFINISNYNNQDLIDAIKFIKKIKQVNFDSNKCSHMITTQAIIHRRP